MWKLSYKLSKIFKQHQDCKCPLKVALTVKAKLEKFKINIPLIQVICNPGIKRRHWKAINSIAGLDLTPNEYTTLKDMLKFNKILEKNLERLGEVTILASKEYALEKALKKMKNEWENMSFTFVPYKDTSFYILASFEDIQTLLDDHYVKTVTMKNSPFVLPFEKEVNSWCNELVSFGFAFLSFFP